MRVQVLLVGLVVSSFTPSVASAQGIDAYKDRLAAAISNKTQDYKIDNTSDQKVLGHVVGKKGKEFTGTVRTKGADVTGTQSGSDFNLRMTFKVRIPFEATWREKNFYGVGFEYHEDDKDTTGAVLCTVEVNFGGIVVKDQQLVDPSIPNHDSTKQPSDAIQAYLLNTDYLKSKLFP